MPPFRIGYNIDAEHPGSDRQSAVNQQIELHSTATTLLDDHKSGWFFSQQIKALSPETLRVCRTYMNSWDGNLNEAPDGNSPTGFLSPVNYVNYLENLRAPEGTIHQVQCEPDMHKDPQKDPEGKRLRANVHWQSEVAKEMSRRGMRGCFDNKQTVTFNQQEIDEGFHDELWFTLAQHPEHFYGVHGYWLGDAWFNCSANDMKILERPSPIDVQGIIDLDENTTKTLFIAHASEAHLGREEIIAAHCRKIGAAIPRMIYTELGSDRVRLDQLAAVERINGRAAMGYPTMAQYWRVHYPQWSAARAFFEMSKWCHRSMPDYIIAGCMFGKDTAFESGDYHIDDAEYQRLLADYSAEVRHGVKTETPIPTPTPNLSQLVEQRLTDLERRVAALEGKG